jgi:acetaldehyde dehydrogenase/alcohol dehydrogenase
MVKAAEMLDRARTAAREFAEFDQFKTDEIVRAVYRAAMDNRIPLAKMAHEETEIGIWQDKVVKNVIASQFVYESIKYEKTAGVVNVDSFKGIIEIARPLGPVLAMVPIINPTSTAIFKILICMKTRNPIIVSTAPGARKCVAETCRILYEAALAAGAPEHCIQWMPKPNMAKARELMSDRRLALVLATGTGEMVKEAHTSGTPTIGVGPAARSILSSKTFDNGSICASEQSIVVRKVIADRFIEEFQARGAYFMTEEQVEKVGAIAYNQELATMSPFVVGQSVRKIAEMAGIEVPEGTRVLVAMLDDVSRDHPLSAEILAPILAFYVEEGFEDAIQRCAQVARFGGMGHTAVIYSNNLDRIEYFASQLNVARILVNTPSTQGALGGMFNTLPPSFTLSCGSGGKNTTTDNISARQLVNIHRICRRRDNQRWMNIDKRKYMDERLGAEEIEAAFYQNT